MTTQELAYAEIERLVKSFKDMPADFLIAPDARIVKAYYGRDMGGHLPVTEVRAMLTNLNFPAN